MIDLHCDTIYALHNKGGALHSNSLSVDIAKMRQGGVQAQCFAMFVSLSECEEAQIGAWDMYNILHDRFVSELDAYKSSIRQMRTVQDIAKHREQGLLTAILTTEEGGIIEGDLARLAILKVHGVKLFTLTWNHPNALAFPKTQDPVAMALGLTDLGKEAVSILQTLGILVDVSHLSDGGFADVVCMSKKTGIPFVASHSNSRAMTDSARNLTDGMLRQLADCGGVAGLNFCPAFLLPNELLGVSPASRIEDMVRHVLHVRDVAGASVLAMGTDFDGISGELEVPTCAQLPLLRDALSRAGMSNTELDMMWEGNALRVLTDAQSRSKVSS